VNPIIEKIESLWQEGLPTSAVRIERRGAASWIASISVAAYMPYGESDGSCGPKYKITIEPPPPGVGLRGWERYPDQIVPLIGSEEQMHAMIVEVAKEGRAQDWARFDGEMETYPHFLTKPNRWLPKRLGGVA